MAKLSRRHFNLLIISAFVLTGLFVILVGVLGLTDPSSATVRLGDQLFKANIAETDEEKARGLSGVDRLEDDEALLFVNDSDKMNRIWMKDMNFAIDVVWLSSDWRVVHIERSLQPSSYPNIYSPNVTTRYVVELPEGSVNRNSIKVGSYAKINYKDRRDR